MVKRTLDQFTTSPLMSSIGSQSVILPIVANKRARTIQRAYRNYSSGKTFGMRRFRKYPIPPVIKMLQPEKKEYYTTSVGNVLSVLGNVEIQDILNLPMGGRNGSRIGNQVAVTSFHHRVFIKGTDQSTDSHFIRFVRYRPREPNASLDSTGSFTLTSHINHADFTVLEDQVGKIGDGGVAQGNGDGIQVMDFGRKFKTPFRVYYADSDVQDNPTNSFERFAFSSMAEGAQAMTVDIYTSVWYYDC